ncbi:MAG TPA: tRNA preQ1(34) S-adenosylmethionine ribosyltransferase-isomerase QueA [Polyangiales bacterium]|nr:tRNA preQ1(34) S-adenosylmethionine ribosyltransferase-isomerase QueA [Polyangiales bacterium]
MQARELDYPLPEELIAQAPLAERDASRLLWLRRDQAGLSHRSVRELPELLSPSLIVLNDTQVIPARLFATKPSGGRVEFLLLERLSPAGERERWSALGKTSRGLRTGMTLQVAPDFDLEVLELTGGGELTLSLAASGGVSAALERHGLIPLPPYIRRQAELADRERYQTVFASQPGAVAAPTAGLHLSQPLLAALRARGHELAYVTLHVGPGTFAPLRGETLTEHRMHEERFVVPEATSTAFERARRDGRQVLAIGTTVVRVLESRATAEGRLEPGAGSTGIFIYPPYQFRAVDALLTNFHLPRSTLLALVMAFAGIASVREAYAAAIAERYRFFSYGDAMLISGKP